jgi:RNA polymerase sigma-70 factor (ECF subfamily)
MGSEKEHIIDQILVMDAQDGDADAMEKLVSRWQKRLWCYAYRLSASTDGAWEITQEAWIAIIKGLQRLNDPANFVAWAYRIVTYKSCDWIKQKIKKHQSLDEFEICCDKGQDVESEDNKSDIVTIMSRLSLESRTVLSLYYLDGFSMSDISAILNIPEGTVKSRLFGARGEFKNYWQKHFD